METSFISTWEETKDRELRPRVRELARAAPVRSVQTTVCARTAQYRESAPTALGKGLGQDVASMVFEGFYTDRRVLVTGDTGFKGSWLCLWLAGLGSAVVGYGLPTPSESRRTNFDACEVSELIAHIDGDVLNAGEVMRVVDQVDPEVIFHLAGQPLLLAALHEPVHTFAVNVMGTANVLEAARCNRGTRAVVVVTSDKCYRNRSWVWGYRETDELGGDDPYCASKACAEFVTMAYRGLNATAHPAIASARAGNVVGGGDWSPGRLIPDVARALSGGASVALRAPNSIRPWQHVLEPLSGYLLLGSELSSGSGRFATAWNFGPTSAPRMTVLQIATAFLERFDAVESMCPTVTDSDSAAVESPMLWLSSEKAQTELGWDSVWSVNEMLDATAEWYEAHLRDPKANLRDLIFKQIDRYCRIAKDRGLRWAGA